MAASSFDGRPTSPPTVPTGGEASALDPAGSTLMHDPYEPHPWDEQGPPTGELATHGDTAFGTDPGSAVLVEEDRPPSFVELGSAGVEDLPDDAVEDSWADKRRAIIVGLLLGAAIGLGIVAVLARVAAL